MRAKVGGMPCIFQQEPRSGSIQTDQSLGLTNFQERKIDLQALDLAVIPSSRKIPARQGCAGSPDWTFLAEHRFDFFQHMFRPDVGRW